MKLFWKYIETRRDVFVVAAVMVIIFIAAFALYRLPFAALLYPLAVCLLAGMVFIFIHFLRMKKRHEDLEFLKGLNAEIMDSLPDATSIPEQDYCELIEKLRNEIFEIKASAQAEYRDMSDYYTVWAHQIKTPIASMKLALQSEDSSLSRRLSSDLLRMQQYVEMVLAYVRLGSESNDYVFKKHSLDEIIRPCIRKLASEFIGRKLSLSYEPIEAELLTDDKWFAFVLEQILTNALKYTKEGGIRIYLSDEATLCIEDTGIGIAPEDLPRVFEKGYTGYNGRADKEATGLGLYLCKRVCERMGHDISVISEPGKGTCVSIGFGRKASVYE